MVPACTNPESYKAVSVEVIANPDRKTIDQAARSTHKAGLETLEAQWRQFFRSWSDPDGI